MLDEFFDLLSELAFAAANNWREHHDAVFGLERHHALDNLRRSLPRNRSPAFWAMRHANRRIQQPQIVVDFCNRAHRRTWAAAGGFLFDGNRGTQAVDRVHIRPLHLIEELASVGRQGLDIAALSFGIDRVESERRLARSAQSGDDGQGIARDHNINILKVMLTCAPYCDFPDGHNRASTATFVTWTGPLQCWSVGLRGFTRVS